MAGLAPAPVAGKVKVGVVGLGNQGLAHVEALKGIGEAELVAVADVDLARAKKVAEEYGVPAAYGSARELCERGGVDAVVVATPDHLHFEPVMAALECGKHVLVEKPMATRLEEAERMAAEAGRRGAILMVNFENRFNPPFAHVKELLRRGELGSPLYMYARLSDTLHVPRRMLSWASRTSVAFFLMSHTADLARWYFERPVREVYAVSVSKVLRDLGTPDAYAAVLRFDEGFALLESGWVLPESSPSIFDFKLELVCTEGAVHVDTEREAIAVAAKSYGYPHLAKLHRVHGLAAGFLREADRHFLRCVLGLSEPAVTAEDGVENVRIIEAVIRSSAEGKPIRL
jgi:predicted dehydrogenase